MLFLLSVQTEYESHCMIQNALIAVNHMWLTVGKLYCTHYAYEYYRRIDRASRATLKIEIVTRSVTSRSWREARGSVCLSLSLFRRASWAPREFAKFPTQLQLQLCGLKTEREERDPAGSTCAPRNPPANYNPKSFAGVVVVVVVALRMTSLQIPEHVVLNETVRMQCNFNLDKELLYSVKWYKDGHEFYRYTPRDAPMVLTFPVPGVNVNVSARVCESRGMLRIMRNGVLTFSARDSDNSQSSATYPLTGRNILIRLY